MSGAGELQRRSEVLVMAPHRTAQPILPRSCTGRFAVGKPPFAFAKRLAQVRHIQTSGWEQLGFPDPAGGSKAIYLIVWTRGSFRLYERAKLESRAIG